jgi:hypothetical protein
VKTNVKKTWSCAPGLHDYCRDSSHVIRGVPQGMFNGLSVRGTPNVALQCSNWGIL